MNREPDDFDSLFASERPVVFRSTAAPALTDKMAYRRANHEHLHVRGYRIGTAASTPPRNPMPVSDDR
jgi:xylulose-5-phosphate/fructose-6-phosphate phosphoketolase